MSDTSPNKRLKMSGPTSSFIPVPEDSHFPIQNIPFGVFRPSKDAAPRVATRVGDTVSACHWLVSTSACFHCAWQVVDLAELANMGYLTEELKTLFNQVNL